MKPEDVACSRCGRPFFGSAIAKTANPAPHPTVLCELRSRGPVEPDLMVLPWAWCIDCTPHVKKKLHELGFLRHAARLT